MSGGVCFMEQLHVVLRLSRQCSCARALIAMSLTETDACAAKRGANGQGVRYGAHLLVSFAYPHLAPALDPVTRPPSSSTGGSP